MLSIASYIDFYVVKIILCKSSCIYYLKKCFFFVFFPIHPKIHYMMKEPILVNILVNDGGPDC